MYILLNAIKNLGRNKGRNILVGIIIFALIVAIAVSLIINTTANAIISDYKDRFGSKVIIVPDVEKMTAGTGNSVTGFSAILPEQFMSFAESNYLKDSFFKNELGIESDNLRAKDQQVLADKKDDGSKANVSISGNSQGVITSIPTMKLLGYSKLEFLDEFKDGLRKISKGKIFENKGECVVSETSQLKHENKI